MFISSASRTRARRFDSYVESVDQAMRDPGVIGLLGGLAARISEINRSAFLPNIRHGRATTPRRYGADIGALALLPLERQEFIHAEELIEQVLDTERGPEAKLGEYATSVVSGASMKTSELLRWLQESNKNDGLWQTMEITPRALARTRIDISYGEDTSGALCYSASRPMIVIDGDTFEEYDIWNKAANVGHEEVHAVDARDNPLLYLTPQGGAASEMVAYRTQNIMYGNTSQVTPGRRFAQDIEMWRLLNLGETGFVPDDGQIAALVDKGIL